MEKKKNESFDRRKKTPNNNSLPMHFPHGNVLYVKYVDKIKTFNAGANIFPSIAFNKSVHLYRYAYKCHA